MTYDGIGLFVGIFVAILTILILLLQGTNIHFISTLELLIIEYDNIISDIFDRILPLIVRVFNELGITLKIYDHWKHVFVLLWMYFGTHARMAFSAGNKGAAVWNATWGLIVSFLAAISAGSVAFAAGLMSLLLPASAVAGVVLYSLGNAARAATFYREEHESWRRAFGEFSRHAYRFAVFGGLTILSAAVLHVLVTTVQFKGYGLLVFLVLFFCLALYRVVIGPRWGRYEPDTSGTWWQRTRRSGEGKIGFWMLYVLGGVIGTCLINVFSKLDLF